MRSLLTILLLSISLAAATPVFANDGTAQDRLLLAQGGGKSLNEAVEQVRRQCDGRIVSAEPAQQLTLFTTGSPMCDELHLT